jgi:conjugative transfer signal peptidase TraF
MTIRPGQLALLKAAIASSIFIAGISIGFQFSGVRINATSSLPIGLYKITSDTESSLVDFCPAEPFASMSADRGYRGNGDCPDHAEPLMKPIVASTGDLVELSRKGVAVNGRLLPNSSPLTFDSKHRHLAPWPFGRYRVSAGTVWVISSFDRRSFDSRYFGPVLKSSITSHLTPLLTE